MWTGLVAAEVILEWTCREGAAARTAAVVHYWLDLLVEAPLVLAVAATGAVLLAGAWPPSPSSRARGRSSSCCGGTAGSTIPPPSPRRGEASSCPRSPSVPACSRS